ncbi:MAG: hypothetical protein AAFO83_15655, partial [Cyanobacteria bacterium J06607_13]
VAFVGIRLIVRVINPEWVPPEWVMVSLIFSLFAWGFSKKVELPTIAKSEVTVTVPNLSEAATDQPSQSSTPDSLLVPSDDKQPETI